VENLGERITRKSSLQSYITFKILADKPYTRVCCNGYGYFRWVDDQVDERLKTRKSRVAFMRRQDKIVSSAYADKTVPDLAPQERLITDLIVSDREDRRLRSFIMNFLRIISFDARRIGMRVTKMQLAWYSKTLAVAVTDCIQYFIDHDFAYPESPNRYGAAIGAHITHMLRDYYEDLDAGFINIPTEYLRSHGIGPGDTDSVAFRLWVMDRVASARRYLQNGMEYWEALPIFRGKLAAYWYCVRFTGVLDTIEKDGFVLRRSYPRKKSPLRYLKIITMAVQVALAHMLHREIRLAV
jgi:phytoene/squalene synthetase